MWHYFLSNQLIMKRLFSLCYSIDRNPYTDDNDNEENSNIPVKVDIDLSLSAFANAKRLFDI